MENEQQMLHSFPLVSLLYMFLTISLAYFLTCFYCMCNGFANGRCGNMAAIMEVEEHLTAKFIQFDPAPRRGGESMPGVQASRRRWGLEYGRQYSCHSFVFIAFNVNIFPSGAPWMILTQVFFVCSCVFFWCLQSRLFLVSFPARIHFAIVPKKPTWTPFSFDAEDPSRLKEYSGMLIELIKFYGLRCK